MIKGEEKMQDGSGQWKRKELIVVTDGWKLLPIIWDDCIGAFNNLLRAFWCLFLNWG